MKHRSCSCLQEDVDRLMCCAPLDCQREESCFRVAKFADDTLREACEASNAASEHALDCSIPELYERIGNWESA